MISRVFFIIIKKSSYTYLRVRPSRGWWWWWWPPTWGCPLPVISHIGGWVLTLCWGIETCLDLKDSGVVLEKQESLEDDALFSLELLNGPIEEIMVTFSGAWLLEHEPSVWKKTTTEKNYNMYTICGIPNEATLESWILRHGQNIIILINMNELLQGGYFLCASLYFFFKKNYGQNIIIIQRSMWNYWPFYVYILQR